MRTRDMTPEQAQEHRAKKRKRYADNIEARRARQRKYIAEHRDQFNATMRNFLSEDVNSLGVTKNRIRVLSNKILSESHAKIPGYQIHHCFGYEDPSKFIYIPKSLHLQIHQLLRDQKIPSDSDHWMAIRDLVNGCDQYTYIRA